MLKRITTILFFMATAFSHFVLYFGHIVMEEENRKKEKKLIYVNSY